MAQYTYARNASWGVEAAYYGGVPDKFPVKGSKFSLADYALMAALWTVGTGDYDFVVYHPQIEAKAPVKADIKEALDLERQGLLKRFMPEAMAEARKEADLMSEKLASRRKTARFQTLDGHTSMDTAYMVDDYPYGRKLRCRIRYWIEFDPKKGYRFCSQTEDPKSLRWNAPKKSTYALLAMVMYLNHKGHVDHAVLTEYSDTAEFTKFLWDYPRRSDKRLYGWAMRKHEMHEALASGKAKWTINGVPETMTEEKQGRETQAAEDWLEIALMVKP